MDRIIKFRGKSVHTELWHYGCLVQPGNDAYYIQSIGTAGFFCVSETVDQFTGLYDMNEIEIYENDILRIYIGNNKYELRKVYWWQGGYWTKRVKSYGSYGEEPQTLSFYFTNDIKVEVIGNVHDNHELIKK